MLEPLCPEDDFLRRVMHRYELDFVLIGESVMEWGEYGWEPIRDASHAEMTMWGRLLPDDLRERVDGAHHYRRDADLILPPTLEDVTEAVAYGPHVYLNQLDYNIVRRRPPRYWTYLYKTAGHRATWRKSLHGVRPDVDIYVSPDVPRGYFVRLEQHDRWLCWQESWGSRPIAGPFQYDLKPMGVS